MEVPAVSCLLAELTPPLVCGCTVPHSCSSWALRKKHSALSHNSGLGKSCLSALPVSQVHSLLWCHTVGQGSGWHAQASGPEHHADVSFSFSMCLMQGHSRESSMCLGLPVSMLILEQFFYLMPGLGFWNPKAKNWLHYSLHSALSPFPKEVNEECPSCLG